MARGHSVRLEKFDDHLVEFAAAYADRTEADHALLKQAIDEGAVEVIRED